LRAPTPTAAAELCAPPRERLREALAALQQRMVRAAWHQCDRLEARLIQVRQRLVHAARRRLEARSWELDRLGARLVHPGAQLAARRTALSALAERLQRAAQVQLDRQLQRPQVLAQRLRAAAQSELRQRQQRLQGLAQALQLLDPGQVLERGYSLAYGPDGRLLRSPDEVQAGARIELVLARGRLGARVSAD